MIRELKTFIAVAQEGTFAGAGQWIGLTQAAVSAQIQRLEEHLGYALFDRTGRAARLNPQGQETLTQSQELMRLYDDLGTRRQSRPSGGRVLLGAIASAQATTLPGVLAHFRQSHPDFRTRVVPGVSFNLLNLVDAGEVDLALLIRPAFALQADLRWTTLSHEPFRLLVPASAASGATADWRTLLATLPFIRYERTSCGGRQVERFLRETRIAVHDCVELDELEAITQLVARGVGAALVPQVYGQTAWPPGVRALDLGAQTFYRDIGLLLRTSRQQPPAVLALIRLLEQAYGLA